MEPRQPWARWRWAVWGWVLMWGGYALGVYGLLRRMPRPGLGQWAVLSLIAVAFLALSVGAAWWAGSDGDRSPEAGESAIADGSTQRLAGRPLPELPGRTTQLASDHLPSGRRYVTCLVGAGDESARHLLLPLASSAEGLRASPVAGEWGRIVNVSYTVAHAVRELPAGMVREVRVREGWLDVTLTTTDPAQAARAATLQGDALESLAAAVEADAERGMPAFQTLPGMPRE